MLHSASGRISKIYSRSSSHLTTLFSFAGSDFCLLDSRVDFGLSDSFLRLLAWLSYLTPITLYFLPTFLLEPWCCRSRWRRHFLRNRRKVCDLQLSDVFVADNCSLLSDPKTCCPSKVFPCCISSSHCFICLLHIVVFVLHISWPWDASWIFCSHRCLLGSPSKTWWSLFLVFLMLLSPTILATTVVMGIVKVLVLVLVVELLPSQKRVSETSATLSD